MAVRFLKPFADLASAPRGLWYVMGAFVAESTAYFGILTLMTLYFSKDLHWPDTDPETLDSEGMVRALLPVCRTTIMQAKLDAVADGLRQNDEDVFVIARVGNGIRASQAVAAALWAFLRYGTTPEECLIRAVNFGGDTDTIGAMAGALVGALHGASWLPARWLDSIENGERGRDEIVLLARRLASVDIR